MNVVVPPQSSTAIVPRLRVMVVDDAVVVRGLFSRWVKAEPDLDLVAALRTGSEAVHQLDRVNPDVVVLDVDMPELDGMSALPLLLEKKRDLVVIMASTLTRRNAEISLRALSLGASDYIPKPAGRQEITGSATFRRELLEKIRQLGMRAMRLRVSQPRTEVGKAALYRVTEPAAPRLKLRPMPVTPPRVLLIGASTGGPQALNTIMTRLDVFERAPVLITQHMPPTFTTILAEHLERISKRRVREARDGEEINAGTVYLAPGDRHMLVARRDGVAVIALDDGPPLHFCKPAVNPLFASAAQTWGHRVLALVLTGMGTDGLDGAKAVVASGGNVMAQDEKTSIIWGMPSQVAYAGLCSAVLPLQEIAPRLNRLFAGGRV